MIRGEAPPSQPSTSTPAPAAQAVRSQPPEATAEENKMDTSSLPPVTAPPSHPVIDPNAVGVLDGRSIFEVDLSAMGEKPWRRPGSDISDWFNYGFDEISWEAYCYRRRELGEMANVLKTNVIVSLIPSTPIKDITF
jgi:pre-mRNA 3'-end-processing factor FIP1